MLTSTAPGSVKASRAAVTSSHASSHASWLSRASSARAITGEASMSAPSTASSCIHASAHLGKMAIFCFVFGRVGACSEDERCEHRFVGACLLAFFRALKRMRNSNDNDNNNNNNNVAATGAGAATAGATTTTEPSTNNPATTTTLTNA